MLNKIIQKYIQEKQIKNREDVIEEEEDNSEEKIENNINNNNSNIEINKDRQQCQCCSIF